MNAEKELLLALLIEKHTQPKKVAAPLVAAKRKRSRVHAPHFWTDAEKHFLLIEHAAGRETGQIAREMNLRSNQVGSMLYKLLQQNKAGE